MTSDSAIGEIQTLKMLATSHHISHVLARDSVKVIIGEVQKD
jgi:hypothetical protein